MKQLLWTSLLILISGLASAADSVGKVILSFGQNYAVSAEGERRQLKRQSEVFANDTLQTSEKGRLQLRFTDGSRLSLKPQSEFQIAEYGFDSDNPEDGKAIYKLLKGGMRTISGQIGKVNRENYRLETVVATIGIRGTHYGTEFTPEGLYTETLDGKVVVETPQGTVEVVAGESVKVNAKSGVMQKGKATGQTAQGETETTEESSSDSQESGDSEETQNDSQETASEETAETDGQTGSEENTESSSGATSDDSSTASSGGDTDAATGISMGDSGSGSTTDSSVPATDPNTSTNQPAISSPNPTGSGTAAPKGAFSLVAFIEDDSIEGARDSNGVVYVDDTSALTVDSSSGQDRLTGILYVDTQTSASDNCNPCTMTAPVDQTLIRDAGSEEIGGVKVSWGRWNAGSYEVVENGNKQKTLADFHFIYASDTTPSDVIAAKTGSYVYTFTIGNPITIPQFQDGSTGELVQFGTGASLPPGGSLRQNEGYGTYMQVDWNSQKITEVGLEVVQKNAGRVINTYKLTEQVDSVSGNYIDTPLNDVLNGGELKLSGSCSGSGVCGTSTELSGRLNMEFVGNSAEGVAVSYGASGSSTGTVDNDISVVGTAVLKKDASLSAP